MSTLNALFFFLGTSGTVRYEGDADGVFRVADTTLDRYELFVGVGSTPSTSGTADETSATLPFTYTIPGAGEYHLVTVKRNKYGLITLVGQETVITIASGGAEVLADPSAPTSVTLTALAAGKIRVQADYGYQSDAENVRADEWVVLAKVGSDPTPGVDSPVLEQAHYRIDWIEQLDFITDAFNDADDVHIIVGVKRSTDSVATYAAAVTITAETDGPTLLQGGGFAGDRHRQE